MADETKTEAPKTPTVVEAPKPVETKPLDTKAETKPVETKAEDKPAEKKTETPAKPTDDEEARTVGVTMATADIDTPIVEDPVQEVVKTDVAAFVTNGKVETKAKPDTRPAS